MPLSLDEYQEIARKMLWKKVYNHSLLTRMLVDIDVISEIVRVMIKSDSSWSPNGGASLKTYRYNAIVRVIFTYFEIYNKQKIFKNITRKSSEKVPEIFRITVAKDLQSGEIMEQKENRSNITKAIDNLLANGILSKKQSLCLRMYYLHGKTLHKISSELNITKAAVYSRIKLGLESIRQYGPMKELAELL